jgi:hypothetical protein
VSVDWETANRDALVAELALVRAWLGTASGPASGSTSGSTSAEGADRVAAAEAALAAARDRLPRPSALDEVCAGFGLSTVERALLVLAAGPELAAGTASQLSSLLGADRPTFGLALAAIPGAYWGALTPRAPLRHWQLVQLLDPTSPTHSPLVVDERVLHHLLGAGYLDPDLAAVARTAPPAPEPPPTLLTAADAVVSGWEAGLLVALAGPQRANLVPVAAAAAGAIGRVLHVIDAADVPAPPLERERLARLMERESALAGCAWAIDAMRAADPTALLRGLGDIDAPVAVLADTDAPGAPETALLVHVPRVPMAERRAALERALRAHGLTDAGAASPSAVGPAGVEPVAAAVAAFDLAVPDMHHAVLEVAGGRTLWEACRARASSRFDGLAQVIEPRAGWDDLVLPDPQQHQLKALVAAVQHRSTVLDAWGFAGRSSRGLGTAALFAGASGTGKTLAAEVIASSLGLDLVVVDLSQVVSKYIGETEKNLRRVFDAAEDAAAVLLFDEADTLFGKRTEIRDSHDRYANLEVGYLLQRIESFRGLAILTTNAKSVLDQAFLRRLRFVVSFPYPDPAARERMWRRAFPGSTPTVALEPARLAAIDLPGGGIAAAALTAAYLGASRGEVTAEDVAAATRWEMAKLGRSVAGR